MSNSVRHPSWPLLAMAALPASQRDQTDLPTSIDEIEQLVLAHARLLTERRNDRDLDVEMEVLGKALDSES